VMKDDGEGPDKEEPNKPFSFYIGEGVNYVKGDLVSLFGKRKKKPESATPVAEANPEELLEYIESLQLSIEEIKEDGAAIEHELHSLRKAVRALLRGDTAQIQRSRSGLY